MNSTHPLYHCKNISFSYPLGEKNVQALSQIELKIEPSDFVVFSGPSGSGKSTLLNLLGLIEPIQEGEIYYQGKLLNGFSEQEKNNLRRFHLGYIFQSFHLINILSAYENVEYFLIKQNLSPQERRDRVLSALHDVGLAEQTHKKPLEMSGGQRQRVAIARALAKRPNVIIADEPTANLDQTNGKEIMRLLKELSAKQKTTILVASHDPMVMQMASHTIRLCDGRLI